MSKHTPGPWQWDENRQRLLKSNPETFSSETILMVHEESFIPKIEDADLIGSAPDMAEALKMMLEAHKQLMPGVAHIAVQDYAILNDAPVAARAALEKAGIKI